jgi:3-deoxy-D-manno-octulosonic-acid transferase
LEAVKFLKYIKPFLILFIENCYYPYFVIEAKKMSIKTLLISAAMNNAIREHPRYKKCSLLSAYKMFSFIGVKSPDYIKNFLALGVDKEKLFISGDLKIDRNRLVISEDEKDYYTGLMGIQGKKVFIAGSISLNEGRIVIDVCRQLLSSGENIKCIIAPRFLDNIKELRGYAEEASLSAVTKTELTKGKSDKNTSDIILFDTYGELGKIYSLGNVIFIGGTLSPFADKPLGQNILEPLFHAKPVVVGPNIKKDFEVIERLRGFWHDIVVKTPEELFKGISYLLSDDEFRKKYSLFIKDNVKVESNISSLINKLSEIKDTVVSGKETH